MKPLEALDVAVLHRPPGLDVDQPDLPVPAQASMHREVNSEPLSERTSSGGHARRSRAPAPVLSGKGQYGRLAAWGVSRRVVRRSVHSCAGISTSAVDMAVLSNALSGGVAGGRRILKTSSIEVARTPSCGGEFNRCARKPIRWADWTWTNRI